MLLMFGGSTETGHEGNPLVFQMVEPAQAWILSRLRRARDLEQRDDVIVRSHSEDEAALLRREQAVEKLVGARELANSIVLSYQRTRRRARCKADLIVQFLGCTQRSMILRTSGATTITAGTRNAWAACS